METLEAIRLRRSVRKYTEQPVSEATLRCILEAAMNAPSAGNAQPWHFVVVRDKYVLQQASQVHQYVGMAAHAPLAVLVCGDLAAERYPGYWVQDCAAAVQNLLLAATDLGVGSVWTGIHPMEDRVSAYAKLFSLPTHIIPFALIVLGYPAEPPKPNNRFSPDKVHLNYWNGK